MAKGLTAWIALAIPCLVLVETGAAAQSTDDLRALSKDVEALKAGQAALQKDLEEIKNLLRGAQPGPAPAAARSTGAEPANVVVSVNGEAVMGAASAKVTLVEFTDYQCPFCARHFLQTWPRLVQDYIKTGKVKLVLRDMPLEQIHPNAVKAAEAARCAGKQGKYWEMHDRLFANQNLLSRKDLSAHAQALGLNVEAFDQCVDGGKELPAVRSDLVDAARAGARGTPTFFLGYTEPGGTTIRAVRVLRGALPYQAFQEAIDNLLASAK
jgi:protein-disulfide isomerase